MNTAQHSLTNAHILLVGSLLTPDFFLKVFLLVFALLQGIPAVIVMFRQMEYENNRMLLEEIKALKKR